MYWCPNHVFQTKQFENRWFGAPSWIGRLNCGTTECLLTVTWLFIELSPTNRTGCVIQISKQSVFRKTMNIVSRLWSRPVHIENRICELCDNIYQEELVHITYECRWTRAIRENFVDSCAPMLLLNDVCRLRGIDSVSLTLRLLGANRWYWDWTSFCNKLVFIFHQMSSVLLGGN